MFPENNGAVFTQRSTDLPSGALTNRSVVVAGNQPKIFAANSSPILKPKFSVILSQYIQRQKNIDSFLPRLCDGDMATNH
ncbi:hypothetical protein F2P81_016038 [Scophthalmus maximus]|uniref:Uncharacterized protein n=1 Tax=Scophthalmus maximus TaxID=52904 RepID=A0A6A4SBE2_SCOMX|nr:hypothetical protein F2P81_016038 [Scophthalmus maximus]